MKRVAGAVSAAIICLVGVALAGEAGGSAEKDEGRFDPGTYGLYPPDAEFTARWEKVKDKYRASYRSKTADPESQRAFLAAWEKGCPMTRLMLTQRLVALEGGTLFDRKVHVPVGHGTLMKWAATFNEHFPPLDDRYKQYLFGRLKSWVKSHGGPGKYWNRLPPYVAALHGASAYPAGCTPPKERPFMWASRKELPALKERLKKDPWKTWYRLVCKISDAAMGKGDVDEELRLRFPPRVRSGGRSLPHAAECCALRYFVEGKKEYGLKAKDLLPGGLVKKGEWYTIDNFIWGIGCWSAWPPSTYDLIADLYTPEEREEIERLFLYRARVFVSRFNYNFNMTWFRQAGAGCSALLVGWKEGVDYTAGEIRKYVSALRGEGEYHEYWAYKSHVYENLIGPFACAYKHVRGTDLFGPKRGKYARSIRHYVRAASPLGTMPEFGDCPNMQSWTGYYVWELNALPEPARGELMWHWLRSGDPRFVHVRAGDAKRLTGGKFPCYTQGWSPMDDQYDASRRERRWPVGEAKLVRAILTLTDPLPEPIAPEPESYIAPKTGVACLRTGLDPDDVQLTIHTRRLGSLGYHGERDTMSFLMYAYGSPVIVHPGYHDIIYFQKPNTLAVKKPPEPCTGWFGFNGKPLIYNCSVYSHSLAAVGHDGGLRHGPGYWMKHARSSDLPVEALVADSGKGYFGKSAPEGHFRRAIVMATNLKGSSLPGKGYFVMVDDVLDVPAAAETKWLVQPRGTKVEGHGDTRTWTSYDFISIPPKPVRLLVHWVRPEGSKVTMKTGIWNLYPDPNGEPRPFPQIDWTGPGRMITVLYPLADGMAAPNIEDLPGRKGVKVGGDVIEVESEQVALTRGDRRFVVPLSAAGEE